MCISQKLRDGVARQKIQSSGTTWQQGGTPAAGAAATSGSSAAGGGSSYGSLLSTQVGKQAALGGTSLLGG